MKAIILAAGRGSRMKGLTDDRPKCLNVLNGKSLLEWQIEALNKAGIEDIIVARGYKKDMLVGNYEVVDNDRWDQTNMVATLYCAREYLEQSECIIINWFGYFTFSIDCDSF